MFYPGVVGYTSAGLPCYCISSNMVVTIYPHFLCLLTVTLAIHHLCPHLLVSCSLSCFIACVGLFCALPAALAAVW